MKVATLMLLVILTSACTSIRGEVEHVSHPLAGWPVSARDTEDSLTQVNVIARRQFNRVYIEHGVGWNLKGRHGGGFYGPGLTYNARVGVELWTRK